MKHLIQVNSKRNNPVPVGLVIIALLFGLAGCQEEDSFIQLPPDGSVITISSPVTDLMFRVAKLDGSSDNVLDNSSCLTVVLPVTVVVDDEIIIVNSPADFDEVEDELDDDDDNSVDFIYPIQVILPDYTKVTLASKQALDNLISSCEDDDDFECIDFKYPLVFTLYDANNQVSDVITVTNDESMCNFIKQLRQGTLISLQFPVTMILSSGSQVVISKYDELEKAIRDSDDDCDDNDADDSDFITILTDGSWRIDSFIEDSEDHTSNWQDYAFVFNPNGTLTATRGASILTGTWHTDTDDGELELNLQLNVGDPLDEINEDWTVISYNSSTIELSDDDDDDSSQLIFKKI